MTTYIILFNLLWCCVIFGQVFGLSVVSYLGLVLFFLWHFKTTLDWKSDIRFALSITVIGTVIDSLLLIFSIFSFKTALLVDGLIPFWLIGLWIAFSLFFRYGLVFLHTKKALLLGMGAIFGPLTYYSAYTLGLISIPNVPLFFLLEVFIWLFMIWLLFVFKTRIYR